MRPPPRSSSLLHLSDCQFFIPEPQNAQVAGLEILCAFFIKVSKLGLIVNTPIQLDGQLGLYTEEIQHIRSKGMLPSEFDHLQAVVP